MLPSAGAFEVWVAFGSLALLAAALVVVARPAWRALLRADPRFLAALGGAVCVGELVGLAWVPPTLLDMNHHGLETWAAVTRGPLPTQGSTEHGAGSLLTWALLVRALPGGVPPWVAGHLVASASVVGLGLLGWRLSGRPWVGAVAASWLALAPFHLRLAPSLSGYAAWQAWSILAACGLVAWRQDPRPAWVVLTGAAATLAFSSRADGMLFLPVVLALVAASTRAPEAPVWRHLRWAAPFVLLWGLRFVGAVTHPDQSFDAGVLQLRHLRAILAVTGVGVVAVAAGARLHATHLAALGAALLAAGVVAEGVAPHGFHGDWPRFVGPAHAVVRVHPLLHPTVTPPLFGVAAWVGLAWWARTRPLAALGAVALHAAAAVLHFVLVGEDSLSFFLRDAAALGWGVCLLAAVGVVRSVRAVPARLAVVAAWALACVVGRAGLLGHAWPSQQEAQLLFEVVDRLGPDATVHHLARSDILPPVLPEDLGAFRPDLAGLMSHDNRLDDRPRWLPAFAALADPPGAVGHFWFEGLACVQASLAHPRGRFGQGGTLPTYVGGRLWAWSADTRTPHPAVLPQVAPRVDLTSLSCVDAGTGLCAQQVDGECLLWFCDQAPARPSRRYLDPVCEEVRRTFVLEPVATAALQPGFLDSDTLAPLDPDAVIGLYRLTGVRQGAP